MRGIRRKHATQLSAHVRIAMEEQRVVTVPTSLPNGTPTGGRCR